MKDIEEETTARAKTAAVDNKNNIRSLHRIYRQNAKYNFTFLAVLTVFFSHFPSSFLPQP